MKTKKTKISGEELILCIYFLEHIKLGRSIEQIKSDYIDVQNNEKDKKEAELLFERIYNFTMIDKVKEVREAQNRYKLAVKKYAKK